MLSCWSISIRNISVLRMLVTWCTSKMKPKAPPCFSSTCFKIQMGSLPRFHNEIVQFQFFNLCGNWHLKLIWHFSHISYDLSILSMILIICKYYLEYRLISQILIPICICLLLIPILHNHTDTGYRSTTNIYHYHLQYYYYSVCISNTN